MQYRITEHPNNGLIAFLSEMESKLPSDSYLQEFLSDDKAATMKVRASSYEEAEKIVGIFRNFESVQNVVAASFVENYTEATEGKEAEYYVEVELVCYYYTLDDTTQPEAVTQPVAQEETSNEE